MFRMFAHNSMATVICYHCRGIAHISTVDFVKKAPILSLLAKSKSILGLSATKIKV